MKALTTDLLLLHPIAQSDLDFVHQLHSLPESNRYNTLGIPASIAETQGIMTGWLNRAAQAYRDQYVFVLTLKETQTTIGLAAINLEAAKYKRGELWYKLLPAAWNKGYATEAVGALLKFAFGDLQLHRVEAGCATENAASVKVLTKAGFKLEGTKRQALPLSSGWADCYEFGILESDWHAAH